MGHTNQRIAWIIILVLLLASLPAASCQRTADFDQRLSAVVAPYRFQILRWEVEQILRGDKSAGDSTMLMVSSKSETEVVLEYFALLDEVRALEARINAVAVGAREDNLIRLQQELDRRQEQRAALRTTVQRIIGRQVREILNEQGIFNPLDRFVRLGVPFPPLNFRLERPPQTLIVSPRERIESIREVMLLPDVSLETAEEIEREVDALGVSSLVTEIGGFGATYPTFVADDASLHWTIKTVTEEWLHQYLAFTPLGFMYLLDAIGVARNYQIATMNETAAGIVSDEIAAMVMARYYPQMLTPTVPEEPVAPRFDFNRAMREIRIAVDEMLARGEVEQAEEFMEERRQYLASQGYYIRKLNQAYFAFHGTYADQPTSVDPIGVEMKELRRRSASLGEFLNRVAAMTRRQDLRNSVGLQVYLPWTVA